MKQSIEFESIIIVKETSRRRRKVENCSKEQEKLELSRELEKYQRR